ncbi:hypothetical protein BC826DRAFT_1105547 [Russula brevipes]|nr:hypothetical protein BC826DRAFT_1105547 [Russula brevipes]
MAWLATIVAIAPSTPPSALGRGCCASVQPTGAGRWPTRAKEPEEENGVAERESEERAAVEQAEHEEKEAHERKAKQDQEQRAAAAEAEDKRKEKERRDREERERKECASHEKGREDEGAGEKAWNVLWRFTWGREFDDREDMAPAGNDRNWWGLSGM